MFEKDFVSVTSELQNETQQDTAPEMTTVGCFSHRRFKITKVIAYDLKKKIYDGPTHPEI